MPSLSQIALSVSDLERSLAWYENVLGLRRSGSTRLFRGPIMERITGIPDPVCRCAWMVDSQHRFQLELFEFERPMPRRHRDRGRDGIGYSELAATVVDLDRAIGAAAGGRGGVDGEVGERRAALADPDGNVVVLTERDRREPGRLRGRDGGPCAIRSIRLSVPDLSRSRRFFGGALGLREASAESIEAVERGEGTAGTAYWADDLLVDLVSVPGAAPWPERYSLSDIGILNIAFATASGRSHRDLCRRIASAGYRLNSRPARFGLGAIVYVTDDQGFSVELVHLTAIAAKRLGYFE